MQKFYIFKFSCLFIFSFSSCNYIPWLKKEENDKLLAEAYGDKLFLSHIRENEIKFKTKEDSIMFIQSYIKSWIDKKVVLYKAQLNVPQEAQEELNSKVEEYKNTLLVFTYEKELLKQNLDTNITKKQVEVYYQNNAQNFKLEDNIVRCLMLKISKKSPMLKDFLSHYKLKNEEDSLFIKDMTKLECSKYILDIHSWRRFGEVLFDLPIREKLLNEQIFLQGNKTVEIEDEEYVYLLNVLDYKITNEIAPMDYVENNIKLILINKRKSDLIQQIRENLIQQASSQNDVKIYD